MSKQTWLINSGTRQKLKYFDCTKSHSGIEDIWVKVMGLGKRDKCEGRGSWKKRQGSTGWLLGEVKGSRTWVLKEETWVRGFDLGRRDKVKDMGSGRRDKDKGVLKKRDMGYPTRRWSHDIQGTLNMKGHEAGQLERDQTNTGKRVP